MEWEKQTVTAADVGVLRVSPDGRLLITGHLVGDVMVLDNKAIDRLAERARAQFELSMAEKLKELLGQPASPTDGVRLNVSISVTAEASTLAEPASTVPAGSGEENVTSPSSKTTNPKTA